MSWPWLPFQPSQAHSQYPPHESVPPPASSGNFSLPTNNPFVGPQTGEISSRFNAFPSQPYHVQNAALPSQNMFPPSPLLLPPPPPPPSLDHYNPSLMQPGAATNWQINSHINRLALYPPSFNPQYTPYCSPPPESSQRYHTARAAGAGRGARRFDGVRRTGRDGGLGERGSKGSNGKGSGNRENPDCKKRDGNHRDWEISRGVLSRLGQSLPGESADEIARWVAERKRNWPSRRNVERKQVEQACREKLGELLPHKKGGPGCRPRNHPVPQATIAADPTATQTRDPLASLAEQYQSSCEEGEVTDDARDKRNRREKDRKPCGSRVQPYDASQQAVHHASSIRKKRHDRKRERAQRRKAIQKRKESELPAQQPSLLRKLLEKEIRLEQSFLLQAFRHLLNSDNSAN